MEISITGIHERDNMSKPAFDPNQSFASAKPEFDPNAPFTAVGDNQSGMGGSPPLGFVAKQVLGATPMAKAASWATSPSALPIAGAVVGSAIAPGPGTAVGAGVGQIAKRMVDIYHGSPVQSPAQEAIAPMAQAVAGGLPEVSGIMSPGTSTLADKVGQGLAKAGQTMSGVKADILKQATNQGYSTYGAPSIAKAQEVFGAVLGPEGQAAMKQPASEAFDASLGKARSLASEIGTKLENGETVSAIDALKARQATDRIISATPITDKVARKSLYDWRTKFDDVMSDQSGPLKEVSNLYRQAKVKAAILNPTRITKSGEPSAFLPLVLGAGARGAEGIANTLIGTSPMAWGLGATTLGSIPPIAGRAALAAFIDKVTDGKGSQTREVR